ncbi:group 1 outer membrane protein [Bradyrhizobium sp. CCBAU 51627]|nr:group 1 outer membrane protein [Bradyrhizobium sp. CCBAU 51627]
MSKETQTPVDVQDDLRTDYALIATGVGAALIALVYLLLV